MQQSVVWLQKWNELEQTNNYFIGQRTKLLMIAWLLQGPHQRNSKRPVMGTINLSVLKRQLIISKMLWAISIIGKS